MIFSKDYVDDQKAYTNSDRLLYIKVLIAGIFLALSIFITLLGYDRIIGVLIIMVGIVWNLFLPLNNYYSLVMSVIMGILYAVVCVSIGLVANAFLYLAYYVPLQYLACKNSGDTFILKKKEFTDKESIFVLGYYILFFIGLYVFSSNLQNTLMCFVDALTATLLAVSALARNVRVGVYYKIRLIALGSSIIMWTLIVSGSVIFVGAWSILLMYIMYACHDVVMFIYEYKDYKKQINEKV